MVKCGYFKALMFSLLLLWFRFKYMKLLILLFVEWCDAMRAQDPTIVVIELTSDVGVDVATT